MKKTYTIIVHVEDDMYWAECPEFEGCFAQAKTIDELKSLMKDSIYLYFNEQLDNNKQYIDEIELELSYA